MDFLPFPIAYLLAGAFVTLLCFVLLLNVFGLPANWIVLGLVALWKMVHPGAANLDVWFWVMMVGLALIGTGLILGVIGVIGTVACVKLCMVVFPALCRGIGNLCKKPFHRKAVG